MARIYISNMSKLPEDCRNFETREICPMCHDAACVAHGDRRELPDFYHQRGRRSDCPLHEKRQPNPFDSVVQLLLDFDLGSEWDGDVRELAQYICDMFKDGAYD